MRTQGTRFGAEHNQSSASGVCVARIPDLLVRPCTFSTLHLYIHRKDPKYSDSRTAKNSRAMGSSRLSSTSFSHYKLTLRTTSLSW